MKSGLNSQLFRGSFVLLLLFNAFNLLNLVFQIFTARLLSLESYGILTALFSIIYLFAIFTESIQLTVAKQSALAKSKQEVKGIYSYAFDQCKKASLVIFCAYLIIFAFFYNALQIPFSLIALNGLTVFFAFLTPIARGILQGKKKFLSLGWSMTLEGIIKVVMSIAFILIGWSVYGAMLGILLSMALPLIYARYGQLKEYLDVKTGQSKNFSLLQYGFKVFIIITCFMLFFLLDTFIARIVFDPTTAGMYAIVSVLAKTLFIGTNPISKAFFPLVVGEKKENSNVLLKKAILYTAGCLAVALLVFFLFSDILVFLFSGKVLGEAANALFIVGLANSILSFINLLLFYRISQENYGNLIIFVACVVIQIILLFIFNDTIYEFSTAFLISTLVFLGAVLYKIK